MNSSHNEPRASLVHRGAFERYSFRPIDSEPRSRWHGTGLPAGGKNSLGKINLLLLLCAAFTANTSAQSAAPGVTTAWHDGSFQVDVAGVLGRSSIILGQPNIESSEALPLGNGRLGIAVWSADGLTAQLNRADTMPDRLSPGMVAIPGLAALTQAKDYSGQLDLYNGEFREQGGGMTATAYVQPDTDTLIVDVTGADAGQAQTAQLKLWPPRTPTAEANGAVGSLSQAWLDDENPGASGRPFGSLSAITADGRDVSAAVTDPLTITVSFKAYQDGHFRVIVASPHYDGKLKPQAAARPALSPGTAAAHKSWWHACWNRAAVIKITSQDGSGEYLENLRNIYLFAAAAEKGAEYPGSQAGVADMLSSARDAHQWDSSAFWHWNLRMQVAANIGAGVADLNEPYFNLYRENLPAMEHWTRVHMNGRPGICVPETMRFNGQGIEYESSWDSTRGQKFAFNCASDFTPYYNARTLSTGAEVSLWVWQQYLATNDRQFLIDNYPLMAASARFLLSYQKLGPDGLLHTSPSNAHENQWDVTDPTTDIAAAMALYPVTIQAPQLLGKDGELVQQLQAALPKIPPLPRTQPTPPLTLLPPSRDAEGGTVIAESYLPGATNHNGENTGLEPVWPYDLIGDESPLLDLAKRSYEHRLNSKTASWSFDPIQAARLGMKSEVGVTLVRSTENSAHCINGFTGCAGRRSRAPDDEYYVEQSGVAAAALQEALVQDYDGLIRIAPATPPGWDFDGSVYVRGKTKVDVQVRDGTATTVVIESGIAQPLKFRNPWPGQEVDVVSGKTGAKLVEGSIGPTIAFTGAAGTSYLVERRGSPTANQRFAPISGTPAASAKKLGPVQLGLFRRGQ
jgi:alpha-L-fucosidase 2